MQSLIRRSIDRPGRALGAALVLALLAGPGLLRLELRTDGESLVPPRDPAVLEDEAVRERFDVRDRIAVVLETCGERGIYDARLLALVRDLSAALAGIEGVGEAHVESLATEPSDRVYTGSLRFRPWLDPLPETDAELARLRTDLEEARIYSGTLIASKVAGRPSPATAILVGVPPGADRTRLARDVQARVDEALARAPLADTVAHVVGPPVAEARLGLHVAQDLARLLPLSIALMALVFWLAFRSAAAVLLPLAEVGVCVASTLGVMGWLGVPVYLTVAVLPVLLTAVGVADELHVLAAFQRLLRADPARDRRRAARAAMDEMARPVVLTSATTALGFLAFALSPVVPVRVFGLFMALGVVLCMAFTLAVVPAVLVHVPASAWRLERSTGLPRVGAFLQRLARAVRRRPRAVALAFLALAGLAAWPASRVRVQDSWVSGFRASSPTARGTRRVNELFGGTHLLQVELDAETHRLTATAAREDVRGDRLLLRGLALEAPERLVGHRVRLVPTGDAVASGLGAQERRVRAATAEPEGTSLRLAPTCGVPAGVDLERLLPTAATGWSVELDGAGRLVTESSLALLADLERELAAREDLRVGRVVGPHEHLATMNFMRRQRDPAARRVPTGPGEAEAVLEHYRRVRGPERLARLMTGDASAGLVTVFVKDADFRAVDGLLEALRRFEAERLAPAGIAVRLGGDLARSQAMVAGVVRTQTVSLALGLALVLAVAALALRSLRLGALCAMPPAAAVVADFALLGGLGIPLGVATSMFAGMTLAIGVDYAIHLVARRQRALAEGLGPDEAWRTAHREVGPAVALDALALGLAFGLLTLSRVPANARLGALMVASLAACLVASLVLLPALSARGAGRAPT